ncbi:translation initiation factor IF-2-like [Phodopus roborovskii]|uniref:translation initiation factor IF-2-like n=1 Tax=Phodopus roborovskii TaxID=109678 RepID=UPI0021E42D3C|nr:translation initiation factor IF-2-like [Phodopus roborovskii]
MPALLPEPRGGLASWHRRAGSRDSGQPSPQPQAWRQLPGEAAPEPPATGHSASSEEPSPPLLPSRPFSRGGKEGSRAPSPRRADGLPTVCLDRAGLASSPGPGRSSARRAGATRPASSSLGVSAPASARSSCPRLRGLTLSPTRRAANQEAAAAASPAEQRATRLQVLRSPERAAAPSGPRGRGAPQAAGSYEVGA